MIYENIKMNSESTKESINNHLVPFFEETGYIDNKILWDNATCHTSLSIRKYIQESGLQFIPSGAKNLNFRHGFPSNSPDLN